MKEFTAELEARIVGIKRQLTASPWKEKVCDLIGSLNGCKELLQETAVTVPDGGWTTEELIERDLAAIRLAIVSQMISIEPLLNDHKDVRDDVLKKLQSNDPANLAEARIDLLKISQGISEADVLAALAAMMWDVYLEPTTVTDQDIIRVSFTFRDKAIDQSAARNTFKCFWCISIEDSTPLIGTGWIRRAAARIRQLRHIAAVDTPTDPADVWEPGWDALFIPLRGNIKVTPVLYDSVGKEVPIRTDADKAKGVISLQVGSPRTLKRRVIRGFLDSGITAIVPVLTVAMTQLHNGLSIPKLVLLGFSSQAIRAAVLPESVTASSEPPPVKANPVPSAP
jgi:hypothetical protein